MEKSLMHKTNYESRRSLILKTLFGILFVICAVPFYFYTIMPGLDNSWLYVLNEAVERWTFGADIFFTYGPLGFLVGTVGTKCRLLIYCLFYVPFFCVNLYMLCRYAKRFRCLPFCSYCALFCLSRFLLDATYFMQFTVLGLYNLFLEEENGIHKYIQYVVACAITALMCFIKFSGAISLLCSSIMVLAILWISNRKDCWKYGLYTLIIPAVFVFGYLAYNPSLNNLFEYVHAALEISSGYNVAMSVVPQTQALVWAVLCLLACVILLIIEFTVDRRSAYHTLIFVPVVFFSFKHGFVRADAPHVNVFFGAMLLFMAIKCVYMPKVKLLNSDGNKYTKLASDVIIFTIVALLIIPLEYLDLGVTDIAQNARGQYDKVTGGVASYINNPKVEDDASILSQEMIARIGDSTVAIYPIEQSIMAYNETLNFSMMPLIQAYTVYTPYLDELNAEFFSNDGAAPEFIVFSLGTIDGRLPELECPLTWNAIYNNYYTVYSEENYLLLQRMTEQYNPERTLLLESNVDIYDKIQIPQYSDGMLLEFSAQFKLSFFGMLTKMLYQIPEVTVTVEYEDGQTYSGRVIPEVLENGSYISIHSSNLLNYGKQINGLGRKNTVVSIQFGGEGLKYYKQMTQCKFSQVQSKPMNDFWDQTCEPIALDKIIGGGMPIQQEVRYAIDYLQDTPYGSLTSYTISKNDGVLSISGWLLDEKLEIENANVYLVLGNTCYQLKKTERQDVTNYFEISGVTNCGFEGNIAYDDLPKGTFTPQLMVVYPDGKYTIQLMAEEPFVIS